MPTQARGKQFVEAPLERVAELLRTALARHNFRIELVNDELCELAASATKTERIRTTNWTYDYRVICNWESVGSGVEVNIEVNELKNNGSTEKCSAIWKDIASVLVEKAASLKKLKETRPPASKYGSARFATAKDIEAAGLVEAAHDARRFVIGPNIELGAMMTLPTEFTNMHSLVCGPTGCGKTTALFIPNLIERLGASAIVTEATAGSEMPDLFLKTSRYRQKAGHRIYYFNPDDMSSDRINPIDTVRGVDDAQALARLIIDNTTGRNFGGDPFWPDSERQLLSVLIAHAKSIGSHLGFVRELLNEGPDNLTAIIAKSPSVWAKEQYRGFSNTAQEGVKRGVFSGLMTRLSLWTNPKIVALTEKTDPDLAALPDRLFTFYLAVPAHRPHMKPLAAMIFNYFLSLAQEKEFAHPLFLSLDEFTNFGVINAIASNLTIIRHRGIPAMIGVQDYIQLEEAYGRNDAQLLFNQPGFKAFYRPRDLKTAKQISEMLGRQTIVERKVTSSGQITEHERGRELLDPSELLALDTGKYIAFTPVTPPILVDKFTWRDYEAQTAEPPLPRLKIEIDDRVVKACAEARKEPDWAKKPGGQKESSKANQAENAKGDRKEGRKEGANDSKKDSKKDSEKGQEEKLAGSSDRDDAVEKSASKIDEDWMRHSALDLTNAPTSSSSSTGPSSTAVSSVEPGAEALVIDKQEALLVDGPDDEEKRLLEAILGAVKAPEKGKEKHEPQKQIETEAAPIESTKSDVASSELVTSLFEAEELAPVESQAEQAESIEPVVGSSVVTVVEEPNPLAAPSGSTAELPVSKASAKGEPEEVEESDGRGRSIAKKRGRKRKIEIEDDPEEQT
ncbi:MAG: type secretion system protein VirD4 [Cyanobacteriota bacterium erpe_2018_sw_21hr_WHONDRS-SW48-000092_B_bin.40]|jgi:type IV secretion system protein VirD4|nr:type secretion system protein VirD4 [Cyanobacteriota bacterium erpe_2018_sw_21hr_WHONDRS-SW48-000092_B_bin.40]